MSRRSAEHKLGSCFFITTTFHEWERHGDIGGVYQALAESIEFCLVKYGAQLPGYVLMPTHLHLLLVIDGKRLGSFMRDFKKYVSQKALPGLNVPGTPIWKPRYDRVAVYSEKVFRQKLEYIHQNPVRGGLAGGAGEWKWSSAGTYSGEDPGVISVWTGWHW